MKTKFSIALIFTTALPNFIFPQSAVLFPSSAVDLPAYHYWSMQGDHGGSNARDLGVKRLENNQSFHLKPGADDNKNENYLIYGEPLYAPVDGEIVSCWCNTPDNPAPKSPHPYRCCDGNCEMSCDDGDCPSSNPCRITRSGNHVAILTKENVVILLAHLAPGSIPDHLCPNKGTYMVNARNKTGPFPDESFIREGKRKQVRQGDFIGKAGNSGASSGPHTHIHQQNVIKKPDGTLVADGNTIPVKFKNAWVRSQAETAQWQKLEGEALSNPPIFIYASPFLRRDQDIQGAISEVSIAGSIIAVSNAQGNLQLIPYLVNEKGNLSRGNPAQAGKASKVRIIHPKQGNTNAMTAIRDETGDLKVIAWQIETNGQITRKGSQSGGPVNDIAITRFPDETGAITAVKTDNGNLKLIAWELMPDLNITRRGDIDAGNIKSADITTTNSVFKGVISATVDQDNQLKVIAWQFNGQNKTFTRKGDNTAGAVSGAIQIARAPISGHDLVVTAVKDKNNDLKLIVWQVDATGKITRKGSATAGIFNLVDLTVGNNGYLITTLGDGSGALRMIAWQITPMGEIERAGAESAGEISKVASSYIYRQGKEFLLAAVRDSDNKLKVICWETNLK